MNFDFLDFGALQHLPKNDLKRPFHLRNSNVLFQCVTESTYRHHVELDGQFLSLDVLDTAGKV